LFPSRVIRSSHQAFPDAESVLLEDFSRFVRFVNRPIPCIRLNPARDFHATRIGNLKKTIIMDDISASSFGRLTWPASFWKHHGQADENPLDIDITQQRTPLGARTIARIAQKGRHICQSEP